MKNCDCFCLCEIDFTGPEPELLTSLSNSFRHWEQPVNTKKPCNSGVCMAVGSSRKLYY